MDFDPFEFDKKFPVSLSLESIATLLVPMGKYPSSDCRSECDSIGDCDDIICSTDVQVEKNLYSLDKPTSSDSYLNICEDCKCKSNGNQVCECSNLQRFLTSQTERNSTTHFERISTDKSLDNTYTGKSEVDIPSKCRITVIEVADVITHHHEEETERDSVEGTTAQRELANPGTGFDVHNDSGIDCGFAT